MKYYMVLNDGETFTNLDGCRVVAAPDDWNGDNIATAIYEGEATVLVTLNTHDAQEFEEWGAASS